MRTNPIDKTSRGTPTHKAIAKPIAKEQEVDIEAMHEKAFPDQPTESKPSAEATQALQKAEEVRGEVTTLRAQLERQIADLQKKLDTIAGIAVQVQDSDDPLDRLTGTPSAGIRRIGDHVQLEAFDYKSAFDLYDLSATSVWIRGGTGVFRINGTSYNAYSPGTEITGITSACFIYLAFTLATGAITFAKAATVPVDTSTVIYVPLWYLPYSSSQIEWRNIIDLRGTTLNAMVFTTITDPIFVLGKNAEGVIGWVAVQTFVCPP
jgi:hypothetical protein